MAYPILAAQNTWYQSSVSRLEITEINIVDSYTENGSENEWWNADKDGTGAIKCYLTGTVLTIAGNGTGRIAMNENSYLAFSHSTSDDFSFVTAINGAEILDFSNVTNMRSMFYNCAQLTTIDVSDWNTEKVTDMRTLFYKCGFLNNLNVSGWNTSSVENMRSVFNQCKSLTYIDVSGWKTDSVADMRTMFYGCEELTTIDVSGWNTKNVTDMAGMFSKCYALTTLDVSKWNTSNVTSIYDMFTNMNRLKSIVLGENFAFNGNGTCSPVAILPTPDATVISGADGNWYDEDGVAYAPADIPSGVARTYYASVELIEHDETKVIYLVPHASMLNLANSVRKITRHTETMTLDEMISILNESDVYGEGYKAGYEAGVAEYAEITKWDAQPAVEIDKIDNNLDKVLDFDNFSEEI